jgi:uncharacterized protein
VTAHIDVATRRSRQAGWVAVELAAAVAAVVLDLLIPALVIVMIATLSLTFRRQRPASLGFTRLPTPLATAGVVALLVAGWSLVQVGLLMPVLERATGDTQDFGVFDDLQGDIGLLLLLMVASWILGALVEETAFRGFVLTRLFEVFGGRGPAGLVAVSGAALLFAAIHTEQGLVGVVVTFLDGLFFGWLRFHYGSV